MIIDPVEVARLGEAMRDENWRFASYLKSLAVWSDRRLNRVAAELGRGAAEQINCVECGACCHGNVVPLTDFDVERLAGFLRLPVIAFRAKHVRAVEDDPQALDAYPCEFQVGKACGVYAGRPQQCRDYPYIEGDVRSRLVMILERAETCPIIFEQIERLKEATGFRRGRYAD